MKVTSTLSNLGIELFLNNCQGPKPRRPSLEADQENPRKCYVYAHADSAGKIFYIGKGKGRRAWSTDRHPLWHRYVEKHLCGNYQVRILEDDLSEEEAEEGEGAWMAQYSDDLVNWQSMGRGMDFKEIDRYHKLRDANRALIQHAKGIEKNDLAQAAEMYVQAVEAIRGYAFIKCEMGLVGQLLNEEASEFGISGEIEALDRLTLCLIKLKRPEEAARRAHDYFTLYRRDLERPASQRVAKRIEKAVMHIR